MRRTGSGTLVLTLALLGVGSPLGAQQIGVKAGGTSDCPTVPSSVGCESVFPDSALQAPVRVDFASAGGLSLGSLAVRVSWDAGLLNYVSSSAGSVGSVTVDAANASTGSVDVTVSGAGGTTTTFDAAGLDFTAGSAEAWSTLSVQVLSATDGSGSDIAGSVDGAPSAVCIGARGVLGDATDDGSVNIIDAQQIARWSLGLSVLPETQRSLEEGLGDNTEDGSTDVIDAQQIARHVVGLSVTGAIGKAVPGCTAPLPSVTLDATAALAGALGGASGNNYILSTGVFADEWVHSGTFNTRRELDHRQVSDGNGAVQVVYDGLNRVRQLAESGVETIQQLSWDPSLDPRTPYLHGLSGYAYTLAAEAFCSGLSLSDVLDDGTVIAASPLTTRQLLDTAVARFDAGLAASPPDSIGHMLRIGKARAILATGNAAGAASVLSAVPTDYVFSLDYSGDEANAVFEYSVTFERFSLADQEGGNGAPFRTAADPRVPWERNPTDDLGFNESVPQYDLLKYASATSPIPLATGEEARLIEAEAAWTVNDQPTFAARVDSVRARYGLGALPVTYPADTGVLLDHLFQERAYTLVATGHRLGDLRRLLAVHGKATGSVFPVGTSVNGTTYGPDVNFPVPLHEVTRNSLTTGCFDRNP